MKMKAIFDVAEARQTDANPMKIWERIVTRSVEARVSDIHLMMQKDSCNLALRIDGNFHYQGMLDQAFARRVISHVKSAAGMDLGEQRRPLEGRMDFHVADRDIELRVSTIRSIHGQDMVVRLFDHTVSLLEMKHLGLLNEQHEHLMDMVSRPHGLILVSGPSGSGKTTTLYATIQHLADTGRKIMTIENPVEYDLPLVNQTQVNQRIGVTFASLLTAILRQDPNVIMVGEIRDEETANTAIRAANTGHLVLATTHATRASRAIETMLSLGVHPYFLSTALRCVIAQVLVKKICPDCRTTLPETAEMLVEPAVKKRLPDQNAVHLCQGTGCDQCYGTGYRGRMGVFEMFIPDEAVKRLIVNRRPADEIDKATGEKMLSLEQAGKLAAVTGQTTIEELVDVLPIT